MLINRDSRDELLHIAVSAFGIMTLDEQRRALAYLGTIYDRRVGVEEIFSKAIAHVVRTIPRRSHCAECEGRGYCDNGDGLVATRCNECYGTGLHAPSEGRVLDYESGVGGSSPPGSTTERSYSE